MKKKILKILLIFIIIMIVIFICFIILDELNFINFQNNTQNIENKVETTGMQEQTNYEEKDTDFTLIDQYGNEQNLVNYRGKKVVIDFWAVWCPPCREEIPVIDELSKEYEDAVFLTIVRPEKSSDERYESYEEEINGYIEENKITIPVLINESEELFDIYNIKSYPTMIVIDEKGDLKGEIEVNIESKDMAKQEIIKKLEAY